MSDFNNEFGEAGMTLFNIFIMVFYLFGTVGGLFYISSGLLPLSGKFLVAAVTLMLAINFLKYVMRLGKVKLVKA